MRSNDIRSKCSINSNREMDTFVGLKCDNGDISIHFPLGYHISGDSKELRKDILLLFATLKANTGRRDSEVAGSSFRFDEVEFPLQSYLYLLRDYNARGYYREQEVIYGSFPKGKISWNRTIKLKKPYIQDNRVFYLDYITRKNTVREKELITLIHEYCVYESFDRVGWLFTKGMPEKPRIRRIDKMFRTVILDKMRNTFNDRNRQLFRHMLAILDYQGDAESAKSYTYGTYRFEYVWEKMIDKVFGIRNKADYFPKTSWYVDGRYHHNASLEPDTIMIYQGNVYILDAKYYKYGVTLKLRDLPESTSINKQITYGEYVATQEQFQMLHDSSMKVYNAFLMPFDALGSGKRDMVKIGQAVSSWKSNEEEYHKIQGLLIDVKMLMGIAVRQEESAIMRLAELIDGKE